MKVVLPETIKVGGYDYTIESDPLATKELEAHDYWGDHSATLRRIRIVATCPPHQFSQSFIHEILHAIDAVYNGHSLDEDTVSALSNGLLQVFEQLGVRFTGKDES